ncbi:LytR/AlgR family response regulator transcription factor [Anaerostipes faecalis]|uniref:LytR/AlgR family response regulator transcription factor n=1 Tax=Anaerostipes faecalis TaxID=2738446 RepID=UPI001C1DEA8B|nr:LytTR family DNA-binding domain-containing protein [Anaerostipes faecalis]
MLHIAICDDAQDFVQHLKTMLNQYADEIGEEIKVTVYYDGLELIEEYDTTIDLIFLDIQMNGVDGLKAAEQIRKKDENVGIIFLTSLKQYALEGYKYQAVNYIVKPMKYIRLKVELNRWKEKYRKKNPYIVVRNDNGSFKIDLTTLHYAETYKRNLLLHTDGKDIICYKNMKELEKELEPYGFFRCHTGFLVNMAFVKRVEKLDVELTSGEVVYVSKPKKKEFMEALAGFWGRTL